MGDDGVVESDLGVPVDGARLFARLRGGSPPRLLYLHHQSGTGDIVPEQVLALAARGVALPDIRGRGRSSCSDATRHNWPQYASDVIAILDALEMDSIVVGGVSFGAGVAIATALRYPDRVSGLALWSSPYAGGRRGWTAAQRGSLEWTFALAKSVVSHGGIGGIAARAQLDSTVDADRETQRWLRHDPLSFASALLTVGFQQPFDTLDELAAIPVPTVVIAGSDHMHPPDIAAAYAATIPLARIADGDSARDAIDAFLTTTEPPTARYREG